jgi:hypothetical protein
MAPFLGGIVLGVLPVALYIARDAKTFLFNNIGYHMTNASWAKITGYAGTFTFQSKMQYGNAVFETLPYVGIGVLLAFLLLCIFGDLRARRQDPHRMTIEFILPLMLSAIAVAASFIPSPLWQQYFATPVPFILVWISSLYALIGSNSARSAKLVLHALVIVTVVFSLPRLGYHVFALKDIESWTGIAVHRTSHRVRKILEAEGANGRVATLSPLYAIESGLPIYEELSTGPFLYRIGDYLSADERERYVATSMTTIGELLDVNPPAAIFVGFQRDLDRPLIGYATANGYRRVEGDFGGGALYIPAR